MDHNSKTYWFLSLKNVLTGSLLLTSGNLTLEESTLENFNKKKKNLEYLLYA